MFNIDVKINVLTMDEKETPAEQAEATGRQGQLAAHKIQQWWSKNVITPMMNSHRLNYTLIEHQLKSYDQFVFKYVPDIIREYSKITFWFGNIPGSQQTNLEFLPQDKRHFATHFIKFQFTPVQFRSSPFTVRECHVQDETYQFDVLSNVHVTIMDLTQRKFILHDHLLFSNILLCSIPIMVQSKICNTRGTYVPSTEILDPGGYFILEGKEKVIIAQEEYKNNHPFVMRTSLQAHNRYSWRCEVRSNHFPTIRSTSTVYILLKKQTNDIDIELPFYDTFIPILAIFRMMGMETREDILKMLCNGSEDIALIDIMLHIVDHDVRHTPKHELAQKFVPRSSTVEKVNEHAAQVTKTKVSEEKKVSGLGTTGGLGLVAAPFIPSVPPPGVPALKSLFQNTLTREFFPHIGVQWTPEINMRKLQFLSFCIRKLVLVFLHQTERGGEKADKNEKTERTERPEKGTRDEKTGGVGGVTNIYTGRQKHMPDNRDILDNKRIKCTGYLLGLMFRQFCRDYYNAVFRKFRLNFKKQLEANGQPNTPNGETGTAAITCIQQYLLHTKQLRAIFEQDKITKQLLYIIGSGNWIANKQRHRIVTITSKSKFMNEESKTPGQVNTASSVIDQSGSNNPNNRVGTEYRQTYATDQTGVSQSLTRHYPMTVLSHLRRVNKSINRKGKSVGPRLLNESQWGIYCGVSTPEGKACGLLSQLALLCHIRHVSLSTQDLVPQVMQTLTSIQLKPMPDKGITLFVNYVPILEVDISEIQLVVTTLRYKGQLPFDVSIYVNDTDDVVPQIHVVYDEGAPLRPLLSLSDTNGDGDGKGLLSMIQSVPVTDLWPELVRRNMIQYKTKEEEFCGLFAVAPNLLAAQPEHTHLELYDASLFSPEILIIPFMNHNQSPRNMFAMNLLRQSVADIGYNYFNRFDPHNHRLWYPQMPLVQTTQDRDWNLSEVPSGINCIVQMMCMPYNMEDAIIVSRAAIDRGLFRSDVLETYTSTDDGTIVFAKPDFHCVTNLQNANYQTIDTDGLPCIAQPIQKRDVIIGRVSYHDSKAVIKAQTHAVDSQDPAQHPQAPSKIISSTKIASATRVSSTTRDGSGIASVTRIPSTTGISSATRILSATGVASVKSNVSNQAESDMKTLREHLLFIHRAEDTKNEGDSGRSHLAILQNLSVPSTHCTQFQKDHSVVMQKELFQPHRRLVVDQCLVTQNSRDPTSRTVKVRLRESRVPEVGDKLSSRHGQKGVIGRIMDPEDMPFTADGQVADLIINPHCMPSRMTIGQLLESLSGKALAIRDEPTAQDEVDVVNPCDVDSATYFGDAQSTSYFGDSTCHCHPGLPKIQAYVDILKKKGYDVCGNEPMFDATTGRPLQRKEGGRLYYNEAIFIGVVYYHRLRHMVADKLYARAKGSVQLTTRQPNEGRSAEGGLRLGEMERDVFISHGATQVLRDRFLDNSDRYQTVLCNTCGSFANIMNGTCSVCHGKADLRLVTIPYALKLLKQELAPAHIYLKFSTQKSPNAPSIFDDKDDVTETHQR